VTLRLGIQVLTLKATDPEATADPDDVRIIVKK